MSEIAGVELYSVAFSELPALPRVELERRAKELLLRRAFGASAVLSHQPSGRPYVAGEAPISISHSRSECMLAVSTTGRSVGIDLEHPRAQLQRVARKFMSVSEMGVLESLTSDDARIDWLLHCWTAKEAAFKMLGEGVGMVDIVLGADRCHVSVRGKVYPVSFARRGGEQLLAVVQEFE